MGRVQGRTVRAALLALAACARAPQAPPPASPAPTAIAAPRSPCALPSLAAPFRFVGMPGAVVDGSAGIYVTKADLASLGDYLYEDLNWRAAAAACLGVNP